MIADPAPVPEADASRASGGASGDAPATALATPARGPVARTPADLGAVDLPDGQRLVRDGRGVRVVHDEEAD